MLLSAVAARKTRNLRQEVNLFPVQVVTLCITASPTTSGPGVSSRNLVLTFKPSTTVLS